MSNNLIDNTKIRFKDLIKQLEMLDKTINSEFEEVVNLIANSKEKVVFTGIGKTGIIARKAAATFTSTGTRSMFLHATEAIHGDLGIIKENDIVIMISNSGSSPEIKQLIPYLKMNNVTLIGITSNEQSYLASKSDYTIIHEYEKEICSINLAPTTSTTQALIVCDLLAIAVMDVKGITKEDFAKSHPGGSLGKKLLSRVSDIMIESIPTIDIDESMYELMYKISDSKLGAIFVTTNNAISGLITDGDLRRTMMSDKEKFLNMNLSDVTNNNYYRMSHDTMAIDCLEFMQEKNISFLPIDENGEIVGIVTLQQLTKLFL